jgi:hypothetical protein
MGKAWAGVGALAVLALAGGCGTANVTLPRGNRMTPTEAVTVIERAARLNALSDPAAPAEIQGPVWADAGGWYVREGGRLARLYYADIDSVRISYAQGGGLAASACVAGLMGPFSFAYVEVVMKDAKVWRLVTDPRGDPGVFFNCAPLWLVTFPRPMRKTKRIGQSFELMRVRAGIGAR